MHFKKFKKNFRHNGYNEVNIQVEIKLKEKKVCTGAVWLDPLYLYEVGFPGATQPSNLLKS